MESESLPLLGTAPSYEPRLREAAGGAEQYLDPDALARVERRLIKHVRGAGILVLHEIAVPATATTIDHLCIGPNAITAIDVERTAHGNGRGALAERVMRETEILAAVLNEAGVSPNQIRGAICRAGRGISIRTASAGPIAVGDPRTVARLARRGRAARPIDVQLAIAVVRNRLGRKGQRVHRISRPDGF